MRQDVSNHQEVFRIIGMPPAGRSVTRRRGSGLWPGRSRSRKEFRRLARTTVASIWAKLCPMQMRGPAPNGRYAKRSRVFTASGSKRAGSKRSGSCQKLFVSVQGINRYVDGRPGLDVLLPQLDILPCLSDDQCRGRIETYCFLNYPSRIGECINVLRMDLSTASHAINLLSDPLLDLGMEAQKIKCPSQSQSGGLVSRGDKCQKIVPQVDCIH